MEIEVLVVPDCPNQRLAEERLRQALDGTGLRAARLTIRTVTDEATAARTGFTGSPTILINGRDPFAVPGAVPSLTCRMYRTPDGLEGAPETARIRAALRAAAGADGGA
ncbi:hypothetical protein [Streptomyces catenulae]|uniref:Thioredoxin-like fold domain-containing protein n=1 Tax=Streptomyces catenulae TaxID=66875 RepID=A0ABV2YZ88_9ACTN|nr:hypothetical protein [Streptomyces catenulae]